MKNVVLILAAGQSQRCGFDKLVAQLGDQTVLQRCLQTFTQCDLVDDIWIVGKPSAKLQALSTKVKGSIPGGDSRFQSVRSGLQHCAEVYDENVRIIVHNAANPFLTKVDLETGLQQAKTKPNLIFGFFSPNAIKQVLEKGIVSKFLDREQIFETQTPQISTLHTFTKALETYEEKLKIKNSKFKISEPKDEAELLALIEAPIHVYECDPSNTKITFASDLVPPQPYGTASRSNIRCPLTQGGRIGIGEDSHRFAEKFIPEKPFRLGGVDVSGGQLSSDGNSDGDIILHALCNALLSAFGDKTFDPIAAPICAAGDTNSSSYLAATIQHLEAKFKIQNLKSKISQVLISLEGAQPRVAPHHEAITKNLAQWLDLKPEQIGLTYTSGEGLTPFGQGAGLRSYVLVSLVKPNPAPISSSRAHYPQRGEIWYVNLKNTVGSEQKGLRPCLVIQKRQKSNTCLIVPASRTKRESSLCLDQYLLLLDQTRAIDTSRLIKRVHRFEKSKVDYVCKKFSEFIQKS